MNERSTQVATVAATAPTKRQGSKHKLALFKFTNCLRLVRRRRKCLSYRTTGWISILSTDLCCVFHCPRPLLIHTFLCLSMCVRLHHRRRHHHQHMKLTTNKCDDDKSQCIQIPFFYYVLRQPQNHKQTSLLCFNKHTNTHTWSRAQVSFPPSTQRDNAPGFAVFHKCAKVFAVMESQLTLHIVYGRGFRLNVSKKTFHHISFCALAIVK